MNSNHIWTVELVNKAGEVLHGHSIQASDAETARLNYLTKTEHPQVRGTDSVRVTAL